MLFYKHSLHMAFDELGRRAQADGRIVELSVYGGAAMLFTFDNRSATKDVDSVFERDKQWVHEEAKKIAEKYEWDENWINDGVKGFISSADAENFAKTFVGNYPRNSNTVGLRVFKASPMYLLAMKAIAMRLDDPDASHDVEDINTLIDVLGINNAEDALDIINKFYPRQQVPAKTKFGIEEIFQRRSKYGLR